MTATAFIAGATGYTGRSVVPACRAAGLRAVAHIRPDSGSLDRWRERFEEAGAAVDTSPWTPAGMAQALERIRPDYVFALLGTTAKRAKGDGVSTYEAVDYGLTALLLDAACALEPRPVFVYLSSAGAGGRALNAYMEARVRCERRITESGIEHVIARPSFITGPDREEDRPAERVGAVLADGLFRGLAAIGVRGPGERFGSITGEELARALVNIAVSGERGVFEAAALQAAHRS